MFDDISVLVISGPGGAGKGTIVQALLSNDNQLWLSRSWTTRKRRPGEPHDAYCFVDQATFADAIEAGKFLEWVDFLDYQVGTPIPAPPSGVDVMLEIDVQGARRIKKLMPSVILVFLEASDDELRARMARRGDSEHVIEARVAKASLERATAIELGYNMMVNHDKHKVVADIESLIAANRKSNKR